MLRYNDNQQIVPPAPFVHVTLSCHETGETISDVPAQLDCAADRTVIPGRLVAQLGLVPLDEVPVSGFGEPVLLVPTYRVGLALRDMQSTTVEVLAHPDESYVLLGSDVLNHHHVVLDGPKLTVTIDGGEV